MHPRPIVFVPQTAANRLLPDSDPKSPDPCTRMHNPAPNHDENPPKSAYLSPDHVSIRVDPCIRDQLSSFRRLPRIVSYPTRTQNRPIRAQECITLPQTTTKIPQNPPTCHPITSLSVLIHASETNCLRSADCRESSPTRLGPKIARSVHKNA